MLDRYAAALSCSNQVDAMAELWGKVLVNVISYVPPNLPHYYTFTAASSTRRTHSTVAHLLELARPKITNLLACPL